jgi:hypothetical protein
VRTSPSSWLLTRLSTVDQVNDPDFLRIGTKERDEALKALGDHFAEGRLPVAHYDDRVTKAIEAETRGDIRALFADLPPPYPGFLAPPVPQMPQMPAVYGRYDLVGTSHRNKVVAGVLQIFLPFGIGRFYTGHTAMAVAQLLLSMAFVGVIWCWIDGIVLLVNGGKDADGRWLRG